MTIAARAQRRTMAACAAWLAWSPASGTAAAPDSTPRDEPAFQGHTAETQWRTEAAEARRRALFFDDADVEIGPQGLPCDHLLARKPQAVAGRGFVVLLAARTSRAMKVRVWLAPGDADSAADAARRAVAHLKAHVPDATPEAPDVHEFAWCR